MLLMLGFVAPLEPALGLFMLLMAANMIALTGVYQAIPGTARTVEQISGWIGVPLAAFGIYGGLALLLEDAAQRTVLPIGRRGRARLSIEGDIAHQIEQAEREAGIRRQL